MKNKAIVLALFVSLTSLTACSHKAPRLAPGFLDKSKQVTLTNARITNIIQLSEKEAPTGKVLLGSLVGAIAGAAIAGDNSDTAQYIFTDIGSDLGEDAVTEKYGKTIYKLTLKLSNGQLKQVYVKGGMYQLGQSVKVTLHKQTGQITSFKT